MVHAVFISALSAFFLLRLRLHEMAKDKPLAQLSSLFLVAGAGIIFLATSWPVMVAGQVLSALGAAFLIPVRCVATSMVAQDHFAALYTGISVKTYAGMLTGGPLFASIFRWSMQLGDFWTGMPNLVAAGFLYLLHSLYLQHRRGQCKVRACLGTMWKDNKRVAVL
jgi:predicted MFS family arabinose efflux permease